MSKVRLVVTDIDNTLFDWIAYYSNAFPVMLRYVADQTKIPYEQLIEESKVVFEDNSIEYPFLVQSLPSVQKGRSRKAVLELASAARDAFKAAALPYLVPYAGVEDALKEIKAKQIPLVALTDAPRYVAMWKLNKLGLLHYFDAIYGLEDPKLPISEDTDKVLVDEEILLKHIRQKNFDFQGRVRTMPDDYEKPGTKGLKTVLMEFDLDETKRHKNVLWIGDNPIKDVELGTKLGVKTAWAKYGINRTDAFSELLKFSPLENIRKNSTTDLTSTGNPDIVLTQFNDILSHI